MSSDLNNIKLAIRDDKSKVVYAMYSGCSKHKTENLKLLIKFIWKFLGTVCFGNDHIAAILGYGDLQWGNILITRVYFVKLLGHNLFSVGQFCDSDLEVTFRRNTCFVRNLEGVDLLKGNRTINLYTINLHEMTSASLIYLMACATSTISWLWHQRKRKKSSHPPKPVPNSKQRLHLLHMHLCGPMRIESINGKRLGLDLTYAPSTITSQKPTEHELDLLFKAMNDDYIGDQPSAATRTATAAQVLQTPTAYTTTVDSTSTPTNSYPQAADIPNTSQEQQHLQQQDNQAPLQTKTVVGNVSNAMLDGNTFVNPFAPPSTSAAESSSSQYVDPSKMHTFYQPYPHEYQWTKDHPL
ncbi:hypothetical protein Tco_0759075 [Tanacetum coccineum]